MTEAPLGAAEAEYAAGSRPHKVAIGSCVVFLALFTALAVFALLRPGVPDRVIVFAVFAGLALLPLIGLVVLIVRLGWRVLIYEKGFVLQQNRSSEVVLWEEVAELREKQVVGRGYDHTLRVRLDSGRELKLDLMYRDLPSLIGTIRERSHPHILAKVLKRLQQGEQVAFDTLKVSSAGLEKTASRISWDEVEGIKFQNNGLADQLLVCRAGSTSPWYRRNASKIPNLGVLLALVDRFTSER
jgi:hypothetical protein